MRKPFVVIAVCAVLVFLGYGYRVNCATQPKTAAKPAVQGVWTDDWNTAIVKAKKEKKPVFVDFYADWCQWCKRLDKDTYPDPAVQKRMREGWVSIKVDTDDASKSGAFNGKVMTYPRLAQYFGVNSLPLLLFIDKAGKPVGTIPGYLPAKQFSRALDYFKQELYTKNVDLESYLGGR